MRVIIAGSRDFPGDQMHHIYSAILRSRFKITTVISGGPRGIDQTGEEVARRKGLPFERFPADWEKHGRSAGIIRNKQMADTADALIALWDGQSLDTKHMIDVMRATGKPVYVHRPISLPGA